MEKQQANEYIGIINRLNYFNKWLKLKLSESDISTESADVYLKVRNKLSEFNLWTNPTI